MFNTSGSPKSRAPRESTKRISRLNKSLDHKYYPEKISVLSKKLRRYLRVLLRAAWSVVGVRAVIAIATVAYKAV